MSSYVFMKVLESAPERYDAGIRILTLGRLDRAYDRLASHIKPGQKVLDIGCGTGALTLRAARRGGFVKGIDVNPAMLDIAQKRVATAGLAEKVELRELGVAELEDEKSGNYDAVMSGLVFSELTADEAVYGLREAFRLLKPGGLLLLADESEPKNLLKKLLHKTLRFPLKVITYLLTQTTTHAVKDLPVKIRNAGFQVENFRSNRVETFIEIVARKPIESDNG
jgi:ubiquinone/menaquinone biosynthesis C-methylase UbiE